MIRRGVWPALAIPASLLLTALVYAPTLGYGFYYDDYHFVHPYTGHEVRAAFSGPWDASGIETNYYRPLTICLYAARFALLDLDARASHLASLILFAAAAALFASFVTRITRSTGVGALGAAVFVVHPGMPYSAVAWVTNQMHLAALLVVLTALLWWFHVRARGAAWWLPLLALQAAAFLIKEDGIMLVPAILAVHVLRKYLVERDLRMPWLFLAAAVILGAGLLLLRAAALHGVPTHRMPSFDQMWTNWTRGLDGAFRLLPAKRPWQPQASWFVTLAPLAALACWRRLLPEFRFAAAAGIVLGVLFVLPFAFIIKPEQLHLVSAGAALLLTGALGGLLRAFSSSRGIPLAIGYLALAGLAAMTAVTRNITQDFAPFGPNVLRTDRIVEEWAAVPAELREYLAAKRAATPAERPDADPSRALALVAYGLHGVERNADGVALRWMSGATGTLLVRRGTRLVTFSARHERGAFREPAHVRIEADGRVVADTILDDGRWHEFAVPLRQRAWTGLTGSHRIAIRLDHAWVPAQIIPGSGDTRTLGLQLADFQVR